MSLRSVFRIAMSVSISAYKRCSAHVLLVLFGFVYVELCPKHAMLFCFVFFFLIAPVTFSIVYIKLDVYEPCMNIFIFSFTFTIGNQFPLRIWWSYVGHSRVHKVYAVIINNSTNMLKLRSFNAHMAMPYANGFPRFGLWQTQICGGIKPAWYDIVIML